MKLPTERIDFGFERATVTYMAAYSTASNKVMPKLVVKAHDQYGYRREFTVEFRHNPGDSSDLYWKYMIFQYPGRSYDDVISQAVGERFIIRFLELCEKSPDRLFNEAGDHTTDKHWPRHVGFVDLAEALHRGRKLSVRLLP